MDERRYVRWLDDIGLQDLPTVGPKAARLGEARRRGLPVPNGFCVTVEAYRAAAAMEGPGGQGPPEVIPPAVAQAVATAYRRLCSDGPLPVAVRSSALAEDLADASFAGQGVTWLHVQDLEALQRAILACWASLWAPGARAYRVQSGPRRADPAMAVLVQVQVACDASGVAFSRDPLGEEDMVVVEAAWGMGQGVVGGQGEVDRWFLDRASLAPARAPHIGCKTHQWLPAQGAPGGLRREAVPAHLQRAPCLTASQAREAAALALHLEDLFGGPQDVEFGFHGGDLYLFQSRPVTAEVDPFFSSGPADEARLWTAGFVNERFPQPVSPLGWTLIRPLLEELAFRQPLAYLGVHDLDGREVLRLHRGHPYVDVQVFQHLYKVFPDFLLPEDAARYFPRGEVALRRAVARPRGLWDPALWASLAKALAREWPLWSPWHNYGRWMAFEGTCSRRLKSLEEGLGQVATYPP
ncbi:MAG: PEP/pyruvate-binding domain-containing protein, partial [Anaerolineae bacterium]|nr:PEP/pyruvate-binding domain-containing protein [Anaerolineae bacterium]